MKKAALVCVSLFLTTLTAFPVLAERPRPGNRPDYNWQNNQDNGPVVQYGEPQPVIIEDPDAVAQRQRQEELQNQANRQKAVDSHNDPMGGFFTNDQSPKNMFDDSN